MIKKIAAVGILLALLSGQAHAGQSAIQQLQLATAPSAEERYREQRELAGQRQEAAQQRPD